MKKWYILFNPDYNDGGRCVVHSSGRIIADGAVDDIDEFTQEEVDQMNGELQEQGESTYWILEKRTVLIRRKMKGIE